MPFPTVHVAPTRPTPTASHVSVSGAGGALASRRGRSNTNDTSSPRRCWMADLNGRARGARFSDCGEKAAQLHAAAARGARGA